MSPKGGQHNNCCLQAAAPADSLHFCTAQPQSCRLTWGVSMEMSGTQYNMSTVSCLEAAQL